MHWATARQCAIVRADGCVLEPAPAKPPASQAEAGDDIVCSAVSSVLQAARLGLEMYVRVPLEVEQRKGHIRITWPENRRGDIVYQ